MTAALLSAVRIVLVRPSHPGNIGAVARAMKTMGLTSLYLVSPKKFPAPEANALAVHAEDIIANAAVTQNLPAALHGITRVYATSANVRSAALPLDDPRSAARKIVTELAEQNTAILFGPENYGLSNADLLYAHSLIQIPTAKDYHSLNLAAAVQIISYELQMACAKDDKITPKAAMDELVTVDEMEGFYQQLETILIQIHFLDPQRPRQLMPRLRRLFNRVRIDKIELNILRGMLRAIEEQRF